MYNNKYYPSYNPNIYNNTPIYDDRFGGFAIPFLLGGLGGAAVVGLSRPRPVYMNPTPYPYYPPYYYGNY